MKVVQLVTRAEVGGSQMDVVNLLAGLPRREFSCLLVCGEEGFLTDAARDLGVRCRILGSLLRDISPARDLQACFELHRLLAEEEPDLVHAHTFKAGLAGRFAAGVAGIPCVYSPHGLSLSRRSPLLVRLAALGVELAARPFTEALVAVSSEEAQLVRRHFLVRARDCHLIPNGVRDDSANPVAPLIEKRPDDPALVLGMVARFQRPKRQERLLKLLSSVDFPWRLLLLGDGPSRLSVERLAEEHVADGRVRFFSSSTNTSAFYKSIDVYAHCADYEALCLTALEAMSFGKPCVALCAGGICDAIRHRVNGFLHRPSDVAGFLSSLNTLARQPALRATLGAEGRRMFVSTFGTDDMVRRHSELYFSIARHRQLARASAASMA